MPKKKKTRKQKIQADVKRQMVPSSSPTKTSGPSVQQAATPEVTQQASTFSLPKHYTAKTERPAKEETPKAQSVTIATNEYQHLGKDLRKTAFLTSTIIVAEIVIRFVFERG